MADDEDGGLLDLTFPQKLQLGAFTAGTLIFLLTYLTAGLLNGFNYVNQWIITNPVPVAAYWSLNIGMIPLYRKANPREWKFFKETGLKFIRTGAPFILFWGYYQFNPPTTGLDRIVSDISWIIAIASISGVILSGSYFKFETKDD